jgi:hypothetical protein
MRCAVVARSRTRIRLGAVDRLSSPSRSSIESLDMNAVVINVTFTDVSAARAELDQLVPQVSAAPGFVAGYWISLSADKGTSVVVFDSAESAQGLVAMLGAAPAMAVTVDSVEVGEVLAHA